MQETPQEYTKRLLSYSDNQNGIALQQTTPKKLAGLLKGKTKKVFTKRPASGKWSVAEILAHLADAEVAISWRLRQILSTNSIPIQSFDQDAWASTFDYAHRDPKQSLETFRVLRNANIALLKAAPRKLWDNYGLHDERGHESIAHMVQMVAGHDLNHLQQIEAILKTKRSRIRK